MNADKKETLIDDLVIKINDIVADRIPWNQVQDIPLYDQAHIWAHQTEMNARKKAVETDKCYDDVDKTMMAFENWDRIEAYREIVWTDADGERHTETKYLSRVYGDDCDIVSKNHMPPRQDGQTLSEYLSQVSEFLGTVEFYPLRYGSEVAWTVDVQTDCYWELYLQDMWFFNEYNASYIAQMVADEENVEVHYIMRYASDGVPYDGDGLDHETAIWPTADDDEDEYEDEDEEDEDDE